MLAPYLIIDEERTEQCMCKCHETLEEKAFYKWWSSYHPTKFPTETERKAFLAGYDAAREEYFVA